MTPRTICATFCGVQPGGTYQLADRIVGGLADRLTEWRAAGHSYDAIASRLTEQGIPASREKVRRWCDHLDIRKGVEA